MTVSPIFGDISSSGESHVDMAAYRRAGHILIAIKASEGIGFTDPRHHDWVHAAHDQGISVMHYHFARPDRHGGAAEADWFLRSTHGYLGPHDYVVYDGERRSSGGFGLQVDHCRDFDLHIQQHSRFHCILYSSASQLAGAQNALVGHPARDWDANYSSAPDTHAPGHELVARQFTDGVVGPGPHVLPGIGRCDVDAAHGSLLHDILKNVNADKHAS